jgi:protein SCO1/2
MSPGGRSSRLGSGVRRSTAVAVVVGAAALGIVIGLLVHHSSSGASSSRQRSELQGGAVWRPGQRSAPNFALRDQAGRPFELNALRGRPVILAFMDSRCHQECPLEGHALAAGLRKVPAGERPEIVVVSVDPWEDTSGSARRAIQRFGLAPYESRWLLGSKRRLEAVWRKYRIEVRRSSTDIEHTDALYLIDSRGFERAGMVYPFLPTWISDDLGALAREA